MKKIASGIVSIMLLMGMLTLAFNIQSVKGATITVPDDYPTIQQAINAASPGSEVYLRAGTYYENVIVNKSLALVGQNMRNTIIDGGYGGTVVNVTANDVNVTGLTILHGGNNWLVPGIEVDNVSRCNIIGNNITVNNWVGIRLFSSSNCSVVGNNITSNGGQGVSLFVSSNYNSVAGNNIINNGGGIYLGGSSNNIVTANNIANNTTTGVWNEYSSNNVFYHNNFVGNKEQALGGDHWDDGYPSGGNYWSNYIGVDLKSGPYQNETGSDGIGDTPYVRDNYPLMRPWVVFKGQTIYIRADGSIDPLTAPISKTDNVTYTLTNNITSDTDGIVIERTSDIIIDGNGYTLQGSGTGTGISTYYLDQNFEGVTIKNFNIRNFTCSIYTLSGVVSMTVSGNNITGGLSLNVFNRVNVFENNITGSISVSSGYMTGGVILNVSRNSINGGVSYGGSMQGGDFFVTGNNVTGGISAQGDGIAGYISGNDIMRGINFQAEGGFCSILGNSITGGVSLGWVGIGGTISGNNIEGGLQVRSSFGLSISKNNVTTNHSGTGIHVSEAYYPVNIFENNICENDLGISLDGVYFYQGNATIFHNNFINNTRQVSVSSLSYPNSWDNGYPSGGNYWSDYSGNDVERGSYQNETGSDGIGDSAYVIDANNTDRYPLTKPYAGSHDVGITRLTTSKNVVVQGYSTTIGLTVVNYGVNSETLNVTLYANASSIAKFTLFFVSERNSVNFTFDWNTAGFAYGNYTISAEVTPVPSEIDISDNTLSDCTVKVKIPGDINGDDVVNIKDATFVGLYWQQNVPPAPLNVDINGDGIVNIKDASIIGINWQKHA